MIPRLTVCAALAILALTASGCSILPDAPSTPTPSTSTTAYTPRPTDTSGTVPLTGAGLSWQAERIDTWTAALEDPRPQVTYTTGTTQSARTQFAQGAVDFIGTDRTFTTSEVESTTFAGCSADGELVEIPVAISAISVVYNLPGVAELRLDASTVAGIFTGRITQWDDPAIEAQNPDVTLPDEKITPVHATGPSGVTSNFTDYLSAAAEPVWTYGSVDRWPQLGGRGTTDVAGTVEGTVGAIGYVETTDVGELRAAVLRVGDEYIAASSRAAAGAVSIAEQSDEETSPTRVRVEIDRTPEEGAYPLAMVKYLIGCRSYRDPAVTAEVQALFTSAVSVNGQAGVTATGLMPVTGSLRIRAEVALALMGTDE
ncbi:MAG: phosphate ABC transporter substrate-binding protein PstS [Microbacterium sp.]|uniref:phosphate ABC transporter substrate-binding protein PstS n=1 Tax=Microbacterium sp. TaxID=51671 RepID=UPI0039E71C79